MAWTAPRTWVTSEIVTSTIMNTHVRDNLLALIAGVNDSLIVHRFTVIAAPGAFNDLTFEAEIIDDWNGWVVGTPARMVVPPNVTRVLVGAHVDFSGATGTGGVEIRLVRFNSGGVAQEITGRVSGPINGGVSIEMPFTCAATDYFVVQATTNSTGTGHSYICRGWVKKVQVV